MPCRHHMSEMLHAVDIGADGSWHQASCVDLVQVYRLITCGTVEEKIFRKQCAPTTVA